MDEQTLGSIQNISKNMQTLADTTEAANSHVLESVRALATSADILNQVSVETAGQLTTTSDQLKLDTEEIRQTTHAVIQAQTQIEDALNGSGKLVSVLVDNTQKLENTIAQANDFKEFIKIIDTLNLRLKEMSMTLDLRLQNLKEKVDKMPADKMVNSIHTSSIDADFMKKVHLIIDQLHSASVEVAQILKPKDEESLWDKYYAGDKAVFVRSLGGSLSAQKKKKVIDLYNKNKQFKTAVDDYQKAFEQLSLKIKETNEDNIWLGVLVGSDVGRLYMLLADILKGYSK